MAKKRRKKKTYPCIVCKGEFQAKPIVGPQAKYREIVFCSDECADVFYEELVNNLYDKESR